MLTDRINNCPLGLTQHLRVHFPAMYRLFNVLKLRGSAPTDDELSMAQGKKTLDPSTADEYLITLEKASNNLDQIFQRQAMANAVRSLTCINCSLLILAQKGNWDQAEFEKLLLEWMVACDQPFEEVERPEFRQLLEYTHLNSSLHIPSRTTVQRRIMKMGEDTIEGTKELIRVCFASYSMFYNANVPMLRNYLEKLLCP